MLMAVPGNTLTTSPASSTTTKVVAAEEASLSWVKPKMTAPKSVHTVLLLGLLSERVPPSQGSALVVPGLLA